MQLNLTTIKLIFISLSYLILSNACSGTAQGDSAIQYNNTNNTVNNSSLNNIGGNVNFGGVQDIGVFRQIIENGGIPSPDLLSENGFFSEHYLEYNFESCGTDLCLNAMLGRDLSVITDDYMNVLQVVLLSHTDPLEHQKPPTDFIFVVDVSGSMASEDKISYVRQGLQMAVDNLDENDRMAIVSYSNEAQIKVTLSNPVEQRQGILEAISSLYAMSSTNIYNGLNLGFSLAQQSIEEGRYARIVLLSDGNPTSGITDSQQIIDFAASKTSYETQLTSIGLGSDINYELMKNLALKGGNFYFVEDYSALTDIFIDEINFFAYPIAQNLTVSLQANDAFRVGDTLGTDNKWISEGNGGALTLPAVYAASRTSSNSEDEHSRRGGGSAMFIRLVHNPQNESDDLSNLVLSLSYEVPETGEKVKAQNLEISTFVTNGYMPPDTFYSHPVMEKSFLMLNLYLALKKACDLIYYDYNYTEAKNLLQKTVDRANMYLEVSDDDDITYDLELINKLIQNISIYTDNYYNDCYNCNNENDVYAEDVSCSTSNSSNSPILISILIISMFFIIKRRKSYNKSSC